jgi:hypothetical protein
MALRETSVLSTPYEFRVGIAGMLLCSYVCNSGEAYETAALSAIFLPVSSKLATRFIQQAVLSAALYKYCPDGRPEVQPQQ